MNHNDAMIKTNAMIKTQEDSFNNIYLSLYCESSKRLFKVCVWEGVGDRTETAIFWPPLLWPSTLGLSRSPGLLNRRPWAHSAGWWLPLLHLISIFSGPQLIRAPSPFGLVWLSLQHRVYLPSPTVCNSTGSSNSTELYNRSTPTRSLKSNV